MAEGKYRDLSFKQWIMQPETMIGISALILSVCGLFISFYEASLIREYQRASVWPNVELGVSFHGDTTAAFSIRNTGIGPARIEAANISYKGNILNSWEALLQNITKTDIDGFYRSYISGTVMPPSTQRQDIFRISVSDTSKIPKILLSEIMKGNINVTACYCSVYDECWITKMFANQKSNNIFSGTKTKVESCKNVVVSNI